MSKKEMKEILGGRPPISSSVKCTFSDGTNRCFTLSGQCTIQAAAVACAGQKGAAGGYLIAYGCSNC